CTIHGLQLRSACIVAQFCARASEIYYLYVLNLCAIDHGMASPQKRSPQPCPAAGAAPHRRRLAPLLRRTWYSLNQTFRRRLAHASLTPDQFTILRWVSEGDPKGTTANELCELMTSDPNTMAALIGRMQQLGLIR